LAKNEIARRLRVHQGMVAQLPPGLLQAQLLVEEDHVTSMPTRSCATGWPTGAGSDLSEFPRPEELAGLLAQMDEKFQRVASELDSAKEAEVREWIRRLGGQTFPGELFGAAETRDPARVHSGGTLRER